MLLVLANSSYWLLDDVKLPYTALITVVDGFSGRLYSCSDIDQFILLSDSLSVEGTRICV
jgi:hypothetical protein